MQKMHLNTDLEGKLENLTVDQLINAYSKGLELYDYKRTFTPKNENMLFLRTLALPVSVGLGFKNGMQFADWQEVIKKSIKKTLTPQAALYEELNTFWGNSNNQSLKNCVLLALLNPDMATKDIYQEEKTQEQKSYVPEAKIILEKILREQKAHQNIEPEKSESSKSEVEIKSFRKNS